MSVCRDSLYLSRLDSFVVAGFVRPVVLLGPIADITRDKLLQDMPDTFAIPSKTILFIIVKLGFQTMVYKFMETSNIRQGLLSNTICFKNFLTKARHRVCISLFMTLVLCACGNQPSKCTRVVICCWRKSCGSRRHVNYAFAEIPC